ncbi:MAG: cell wall hydrolase [Sphingomonadaceae bacterium]
MRRKTHAASALALAAATIVTFAAVESTGANARQGDALATAGIASVENDTAPLADQLADEMVPVTFVSREVVQPLPETADEEAPAAGQKSDNHSDSLNALAAEADSLRELVSLSSPAGKLSREMECLAGAIYFESRGEPLEGQLAVGRVVVNRSESDSFPGSYCGVVYQHKQFSFVRGGKMPAIRRSSQAWQNAVAIAQIAHEDAWDSKAGEALYFHAKYVNPSWSNRRTATARISSHVFYR